MKIDKKLIPIKAHYFCLLGSASTVLPFVMVIAVQLGIPASISGPLNASFLVVVVLVKPAIATLADSFPSSRRFLFLLNLALMLVSMVSLYFVPSMQQIPKFQGQVARVRKHDNSTELSYLFTGRDIRQLNSDVQCEVVAASDCVATCSQCSNTTQRFNLIAYTPEYEEEVEVSQIILMDSNYSSKETYSSQGESPGGAIRQYWLEGLSSSSDEWTNISLECPRPEWVGASCPGVLTRWEFWVFAAILVVVQITIATLISFTDAIIIDTIGTEGNYGAQRAWGTIGWGSIAPISGLLVDLWSGSSLDKNLAPAFIVCAALILSDLLISAVYIKSPKIKSNKPVLEEVLPLLRKPHFFVFCIFVIINGAFDGFCVYFLMLMQEDMAKGTSVMDNLRFLQGLTLFVQCSFEAPLMFVNHWFMRRFGAQRVLSFVFLLYIIRLFGLAVTGLWGPVWSTLVVELLNGPCYGLGFTAIVGYAAFLSPKGTNTTIQSLVNVLYECFGYGFSLFFGGVMCEAIGCPRMYVALGIFAIVVFTVHVSSLYFCPSLDAERATKNVPESQDVLDSKVVKEVEATGVREEGSKNGDVLEETYL